MSTHWTACTPREYRTERSGLIEPAKWDSLYEAAEKLLNTNQNMFDDTKIHEPGGGAPGGITQFIRNHLVRDTLRKVYPDLEDDAAPQYLPLAGVRRKDAAEFITWSGADTVLGDALLADFKKEGTCRLKVSISLYDSFFIHIIISLASTMTYDMQSFSPSAVSKARNS
jgi:hypothetical protein